mmetsp:Transcript_44737/g.50160  ORF Transcript_44737/g.50160 Transcript_44737/m.50160 type:complete len:104 (-) Transcript_44737:60-371(-)
MIQHNTIQYQYDIYNNTVPSIITSNFTLLRLLYTVANRKLNTSDRAVRPPPPPLSSPPHPDLILHTVSSISVLLIFLFLSIYLYLSIYHYLSLRPVTIHSIVP